ncbi:hypothetical protein [Caenibacillus caldisaponilyticus]|uniref:hypothetical protein n=1 Tax=Caenibacillus caldisaponilyticus TaxID=1674942 RepID=UPI00117893B4|nr:hypothetical protein [Caenibacillus caldisaponilyticus]
MAKKSLTKSEWPHHEGNPPLVKAMRARQTRILCRFTSLMNNEMNFSGALIEGCCPACRHSMKLRMNSMKTASNSTKTMENSTKSIMNSTKTGGNSINLYFQSFLFAAVPHQEQICHSAAGTHAEPIDLKKIPRELFNPTGPVGVMMKKIDRVCDSSRLAAAPKRHINRV